MKRSRADHGRITEAEFDAIKGPGSRTRSAARMVLVDGRSAYDAARSYGITQGALSRYLAKLRRPVCPCCGQTLRDA